MDVSGDCLLLDVYKNGITLTNKTISYVLKNMSQSYCITKVFLENPHLFSTTGHDSVLSCLSSVFSYHHLRNCKGTDAHKLSGF